MSFPRYILARENAFVKKETFKKLIEKKKMYRTKPKKSARSGHPVIIIK
jgi:hypothetical protein